MNKINKIAAFILILAALSLLPNSQTAKAGNKDGSDLEEHQTQDGKFKPPLFNIDGSIANGYSFNRFQIPYPGLIRSCAANMEATRERLLTIQNGQYWYGYTCTFESGYCSPSAGFCPERICKPSSNFIGNWNDDYGSDPLDVAWYYTCLRAVPYGG